MRPRRPRRPRAPLSAIDSCRRAGSGASWWAPALESRRNRLACRLRDLSISLLVHSPDASLTNRTHTSSSTTHDCRPPQKARRVRARESHKINITRKHTNQAPPNASPAGSAFAPDLARSREMSPCSSRTSHAQHCVLDVVQDGLLFAELLVFRSPLCDGWPFNRTGLCRSHLLS